MLACYTSRMGYPRVLKLLNIELNEGGVCWSGDLKQFICFSSNERNKEC